MTSHDSDNGPLDLSFKDYFLHTIVVHQETQRRNLENWRRGGELANTIWDGWWGSMVWSSMWIQRMGHFHVVLGGGHCVGRRTLEIGEIQRSDRCHITSFSLAGRVADPVTWGLVQQILG